MLKKLVLKPGVNRENTRYTNENGYYVSDNARFRQGTPEKVGGWTRISSNTFLGTCRALWNWITLGGLNLLSVGTNLKFYIEQGGVYNDITPIRKTVVLTNPFTTTNLSAVVLVTDASHGCVTGSFVTFTGASSVGGLTITGEYQLTVVSVNTYNITATSAATSSATGGGTVTAAYQINVGPAIAVPIIGWGAGTWGAGYWGIGTSSAYPIRLWSQMNFGEDLIFGHRQGAIFYWASSSGVTSRAVLLSSLGGAVTFTNATPTVVTATTTFSAGTTLQFAATSSLPTGVSASTTYYVTNVSGLAFNITNSAGTLINTTSTGSGVYIENIVDCPVVQNCILVSDASRFVFAFGCNDYGSITQNQMLIRWSDQENVTQWTPAATNQAGSLLLSHGSQIITALQSRQEILVYTDSSLYSIQYQGAPVVWGSQLLADNVSIAGENAVAVASSAVYWMGIDKFYKYDGRVQTLRCDLRKYIYNDINLAQASQFFASTNEGFNEVWFFYCSAAASEIDRYVIFNYLENNGEGVWYYGNMVRTAWLDSGLRNYPMAATAINNIVYHEYGVDDNSTGTAVAINSVIETTEFDIDDGDNFGFVRRILPDITFEGSSGANTPQVTMTLIPMQNSGSGANNPQSVGGESYASVQRIATAPIEEFTGQVFVRVRGRQMILKIESNQIGTQWQLGSPRIDIRQDGRRGNS